jgi:hypothetical protein
MESDPLCEVRWGHRDGIGADVLARKEELTGNLTG